MSKKIMGKLLVKFNKKQSKELFKLARKLNTDTSGVLLKALSLLEIAVQEGKKGNGIGIINGREIVEIYG